MAGSINRVVLVGNLTRDPETRQAGATTVCSLRVAVNDRVKNHDSGRLGRPSPTTSRVSSSAITANAAPSTCQRSPGRDRGPAALAPVGIPRRPEARAVEVVADNVQFIGPREGGAPREAAEFTSAPEVAEGDFAGDDDIPF